MRAELVRSAALLLALTLLTACSTPRAPVVSRLDAAAIQRSIVRMREALPPERVAAFDAALREVSIARCPSVRQALCDGSKPSAQDSRCLGRVLGGQNAEEIIAAAHLIAADAACAELAQPSINP